jgi:hypothetical protein
MTYQKLNLSIVPERSINAAENTEKLGYPKYVIGVVRFDRNEMSYIRCNECCNWGVRRWEAIAGSKKWVLA